ncbi:MAG TPA: histidine kinase [Longimicrobium sp.]|uniref:histidine kinase n=1 Tax=Longimicrobium sp. TaxID=2029185 RepID=UPI002ED9C793
MQLLVVLWILLSETFRGGFGVALLPELPQPGPSTPVDIGAWLLRIASATAYPLAAIVATRRLPLWHRTTRHAGYFLGVLATLHAMVFLAAHLVNGTFGWLFHLHRTFEFVVFTVFAHGMLYGERYHEKEREELRLRAEMAGSTADRMRAQVRALKMEWSPRFLTGTLSSIGELLGRDVAAAKRLLIALSAVLRRTLAHARTETVRLEQEVEFVREVLRVEALRRPGVDVEWAMDEATLEMPVPHMCLLAMVYQALPGAETERPLRIRISAAPDSDGVRMCVDVHGIAPDPAALEERRGVGDGAGHGIQRIPLGPDGMRLMLSCPSMPAAEAPVRPALDRAKADAPAPPAGDERPIGRKLEFGTYAAFALFYTLLTLYTANLRIGAGRVGLTAPAWLYVAGMGAYVALWWASMAGTARVLSTRFPIRHGNWPGRLVVHLLGALFVAILNGVAYYPFQRFVIEGGKVTIGLLSNWDWGDIAVYPPLVGIAHGFIYAREYHAKRISELRLRSLLSESELARTGAELQALKAELNPHFLFNALNTVSSLMHTRVDEARRVVAHLSALLRRVLESGALQEVALEEEVEFVRLYLEIEQARFGEALRITYDLHPGTLRARVPHLLIQPLVENAVKHGLRPRGGTGQVRVSARRADGFLEVTVADDGVGPAHATPEDGTGTGLANVRERLRQMYGPEHAFELVPTPGGGATARVRIPFSDEPPNLPVDRSARTLEAV